MKTLNTQFPWYLILSDNRCVEYTANQHVGMADEEQLNEYINKPYSEFL